MPATSVLVPQIERPKLTMFATAKPIPVTREPAVEALGERAHKGDREHPREQLSLRQLIDDLLERRRALPRATVAANELHGFGVGPSRNPGKPRLNASELRWDDLEHALPVPLLEATDESLTDLAGTVVDDGVRPMRVHHARGIALPLHGEADDRDRLGGRRRCRVFTRDRGRHAATWMVIDGDCVNVLCTGHSAATRSAVARRSGGSDGHRKLSSMDPTRCGFSANDHDTSMTRSSALMPTLEPQDCSTPNAQTARLLPSI